MCFQLYYLCRNLANNPSTCRAPEGAVNYRVNKDDRNSDYSARAFIESIEFEQCEFVTNTSCPYEDRSALFEEAQFLCRWCSATGVEQWNIGVPNLVADPGAAATPPSNAADSPFTVATTRPPTLSVSPSVGSKRPHPSSSGSELGSRAPAQSAAPSGSRSHADALRKGVVHARAASAFTEGRAAERFATGGTIEGSLRPGSRASDHGNVPRPSSRAGGAGEGREDGSQLARSEQTGPPATRTRSAKKKKRSGDQK